MTQYTFSIYLQYGAMFFLGQVVHLLMVKMPGLRQRARAANKKFSFKDWWYEDWNVIVATNVIGVMLLIGLDEVLQWKPEIQSVVRWFFAAVGMAGSTVVMKYASKYETVLMAVLDIKSNIADQFIGKTESVDELISEGRRVTGRDVSISPLEQDVNK